jgi:hypothetical protein
MAVTDTCNNGWREPQRPVAAAGTPEEAEGQPTGWSEAQAIGGELESWLEAFTGRRRTPEEVLDLAESITRLPASNQNNWREPLDEVGGATRA